ncbi:hypothetical protein ColLi_06655 [Colletotrichum liriopes]|uniref:Uncharacterized protein n=1 Tax=Colletotrichum liriopes TaxID=708192 RepID=A0AA37LTG0_9PEZI|nr:hypothetical protein ColLi_06655 [Colletotrichum liriopes]
MCPSAVGLSWAPAILGFPAARWRSLRYVTGKCGWGVEAETQNRVPVARPMYLLLSRWSWAGGDASKKRSAPLVSVTKADATGSHVEVSADARTELQRFQRLQRLFHTVSNNHASVHIPSTEAKQDGVGTRGARMEMDDEYMSDKLESPLGGRRVFGQPQDGVWGPSPRASPADPWGDLFVRRMVGCKHLAESLAKEEAKPPMQGPLRVTSSVCTAKLQRSPTTPFSNPVLESSQPPTTNRLGNAYSHSAVSCAGTQTPQGGCWQAIGCSESEFPRLG